MYKAIITNKSNIDRDGNIQITYSMYKDDELLYDMQTVYGNPSQISELVTNELQKIKTAYEYAALIEVPLEITL